MSVLAIIVIVVVVVAILVALFAVMPRMREKARIKQRERELGQRRDQAVAEHREEADLRTRRAEEAEQRARIAEQEAQRERAEAQLREEQAARHERGMADHELIEDHERDQFAGTAAVEDEPPAPGAVAGRDASSGAAGPAGAEAGGRRDGAYEEGMRSAEDPARVQAFRAGREQAAGDDGQSGGLLSKLRGGRSE